MKNKHKKIGKIIIRAFFLTLAAVVAGSAIYVWNAKTLVGNALPMPFGYGIAVVCSGSMEPQLSVDDVIIVRDTDDYQVGDVVVYQTGRTPVVHQIISIEEETVITKGTANNVEDDPICRKDICGEVVATVPGLGKIVQVIQSPLGALTVLALAALLLEFSYRSEREQSRKEQEQIKAEICKLKEQKKEDT